MAHEEEKGISYHEASSFNNASEFQNTFHPEDSVEVYMLDGTGCRVFDSVRYEKANQYLARCRTSVYV